MNKPLKNEDNQEVLSPADQYAELIKKNLVPGKHPDAVRLVTPGQVKAEMGRIYRAVLKGRVSASVGGMLVRHHLMPVLKATEIEQAFNLAQDDPDADTPALSGLTILGPRVTLPAGTPMRRLDGPDKPATREGKTDGDDKGTAKSGE